MLRTEIEADYGHCHHGKNENRTRVEYEWTYANPTPFRDVDPYFACTKEIDQIQRGANGFLLYDDGWRIVER